MCWGWCCVLCGALAAGACSAKVESDKGAWKVATQPLAVSEREWNAARTDLGRIASLSEDGENVIVFSDHGASVLAGGAVALNDPSVTTWHGAARIPAADGDGEWSVGIDAQGQLYRLRGGTTLENVSDRYGLAGEQVSAALGLGAPYVAFALGKKLAVADGTAVTRYDVPAAQSLAGDRRMDGSRQLAAVAADGAVRALDLPKHSLSALSIHDASAATYLDGELLIQTAEAVHVEHGGSLQVRYRAKSTLHGLAHSAGRIWLADGKQLCAVDNGAIACSSGDPIASNSTLIASSSGDVWVLTDGALARYGVPTSGDEANWLAGPFTVYARVCSACHAPGGTAGIDLSTYSGWASRRMAIYLQVVMFRTMPPDRVLDEADRMTIAAWTMPAQ
jgi:hypothetical protein